MVLAVGHSARDTFQMLNDRGVYIEAKPFSLGFRIEHPQGLIDRSRFGKFAGHKQLGAADYKVVHHCSNGRAVYSFCMCPGGTVVAATSEPGRVVTNGMSQYSRAERNANAGIVVGITPDDYPGGPLAGIAFQRKWEERAFELGGGNYMAPGQLVGDFIAGRPSTSLGSVVPSYKPGVHPTDLSTALPDYVIEAIREALAADGQEDRRLCDARRGADGRRDENVVADSRASAGRLSEHECRRSVSGRRRRRAMPAGSIRRPSTESKSLKRSR